MAILSTFVYSYESKPGKVYCGSTFFLFLAERTVADSILNVIFRIMSDGEWGEMRMGAVYH